MAQSANVVWFALGSGAFLCFVELFRSLRAAWALWDSWKGSVRFGQRGPYGIRGRVPFALGSGALHLSPANATGLGALAAAPPTPPAPPVTLAASRSPRLTASGFGTGRDTASCLSRPQAASLRLAPASRARLGEGDGVQHPRGTFRFFNETEVSLCVWEIHTAKKAF